MGSRILSRSFQVSKWEAETQENHMEEDPGPVGANVSTDRAAMDVDGEQSEVAGSSEDDEEAADETGDDPTDVAMVPMADMLNARFESENVSTIRHLFTK